MNLPPWMQSAGLLVISNVFMTFAWYAHLKNMASKPWIIAALVSWGIALFEYLVQVPGVALSSLSDQDITDVLNWMLEKFGPIEQARQSAPYTAVEVANLRKQPLADVTSKRADLMALMK